ncbi:hypothetical protein [Streptomyces sp. ISL-63]
MGRGRHPHRSSTLHAAGSPAEVLTEETARAVFGPESRLIEDPSRAGP